MSLRTLQIMVALFAAIAGFETIASAEQEAAARYFAGRNDRTENCDPQPARSQPARSQPARRQDEVQIIWDE